MKACLTETFSRLCNVVKHWASGHLEVSYFCLSINERGEALTAGRACLVDAVASCAPVLANRNGLLQGHVILLTMVQRTLLVHCADSGHWKCFRVVALE